MSDAQPDTDLGRLFADRMLDGLRGHDEYPLDELADDELAPMIVIWRDPFTIAIVATQLDNGMSVEIHGFQHAQKAFETIQISMRRDVDVDD